LSESKTYFYSPKRDSKRLLDATIEIYFWSFVFAIPTKTVLKGGEKNRQKGKKIQRRITDGEKPEMAFREQQVEE
jgi:hypothetical protein